MRLTRTFIAEIVARVQREEAGFTLVTMAGVMLVVTILATVAITTVVEDTPQARDDVDTKAAYAAAEAGIDWYSYHLDRDNTFWSLCTDVPDPNPGDGVPPPVNQPWSGSGVDPRVWSELGDSGERWTIELLPANGFATCLPGNHDSMINPATGTFRIRATGEPVDLTGDSADERRSVIAEFRRRGFLDYLYFTDYEAIDPLLNGDDPGCEAYRGARAGLGCASIVFGVDDSVQGPFHTNDSILVCGAPIFGRTPTDPIEITAPDSPPWGTGGCTGAPVFVGDYKPGAPKLPLPPSSTELDSVVDPDYRFEGRTHITLQGDDMHVVNPLTNTDQVMPLPDNGVIRAVDSGACGASAYPRPNPYNSPLECADLYVSGTYSRSVTVSSSHNVIIDGNVTREAGAPAVAGLIADQFVRVRHDLQDNNSTSCTGNASGTLKNVRIDAAILALEHSFLVDRWNCGSSLGVLTVNGAIAQKFRGPVGTTGGNGYTVKNYSYDDRLQYLSPPHYIDPVESGWRVVRQTEQVPPR